MYSCVVSSNIKPHLSGAAKFSFLLAQKLNIPCVGLSEIKKLKRGDNVLLSLAICKTNPDLETEAWRWVTYTEEKGVNYNIFFHTFDDLPIEHALIKNANKVYCGNEEIYQALKEFNKPIYSLWTSSLINREVDIEKDIYNIFSFGMAFKIHTKHHRFFAKRMEELGINYIIRFSTGFHERAHFGNYDAIASELEDIYGDKVHFYGFLSDEAVSYFIQSSDLFVNFFPKGVRANNSTIYAVMEQGCPVLTNTDAYSPSWMKSGVNMLDVGDMKKNLFDKKQLKKIGKKAVIDVNKYASWGRLITKIS